MQRPLKPSCDGQVNRGEGMSADDLIGDALEGPPPGPPELDSERDTLHCALRWLLAQDAVQDSNGRDVPTQEVFDGWMDVIERRRPRPDGTTYGNEFVAERLYSQLQSWGYTGRRVSPAAVKRWRTRCGLSSAYKSLDRGDDD